MKQWEINSWRNHPAKHLPDYPDISRLEKVEKTLREFPALVSEDEICLLKTLLKDVAEGKSFLLQCGDCAESYLEFSTSTIIDTLRVILQMAVILTINTNMQVIKMGRMAGQFAKPRSSATETHNDLELPSYKGDIINDISFLPGMRIPNPDRMLKAYEQAVSTLNITRNFSVSGYADFSDVKFWNKNLLYGNSQTKQETNITNSIQESLNIMEGIGKHRHLQRGASVDYYTCHDALLLPYEEALARTSPTSGKTYGTSAHFLWIGDRTRFVDSAHVEFCRGVENPIGIKCGPSTKSDELIQLLDILNPNNTAGRITLIARFGYNKVRIFLPKLIRHIEQEGRIVIWSCDPMHGNTTKSSTGLKTRLFDHIVNEVRHHIHVHKEEGTHLGGIHLEMTGQNVTECIGGRADISEKTISERYRTHCDPRLNANQAVELALLVANELKLNS